MKLGRGLWRLWIIASVLWISGSGLLFGGDFLDTISSSLNGPALEDCSEAELGPQQLSPRAELPPPDASDQSLQRRLDNAICAGRNLEAMRAFNDDQSQVFRLAAVIVGPPIFVLFFGLALVWALKGFRQE